MMAQDHGVLDAFLTQLCQPEITHDAEAELRITEQPRSKGFRFRYNCEGLSHGGLPGEHSQKGRRTYPSVEIVNFVGEARIVVSLVTDEPEPKPHAHSLVGRNCSNGICTVQVGPSDMTACFQSLMIQHATKRDAIPILQRRILEHQQIRNMILGAGAEPQLSIAEAEERAKAMAKDMDLSKVRLCFQAYLKDLSGRFTHSLPPVLSNVVYDSHAPNATALKICRMDRSSGSTRGGEEVYLLCDKVQKDDIEVRFFEVNPNGELIWEGFGDFGPTDVHRQYAIVFKTPSFKEESISKPVGVHVQLRRKSDLEVSEPKPFTYHSPIRDAERLSCKRVKRCYPLDTNECLLQDLMRGTGSSPDMAFGLQPNNQHNVKSMVLCKEASPMQHSPHGADGKTPYMAGGVTQPQMNGVMVDQQHQQVAPNQQVNIQNHQTLPHHHQHQHHMQLASPQQQQSEELKNQLLLMESRRYRLQQQQHQQQGNLNQQHQQQGNLSQQQVHTNVPNPNQGTQLHRPNSQIQQGLRQLPLQQNSQPQVHVQQKLHQHNGFPGRTVTIHPRLSSKGGKGSREVVKVKKEPLECRELKENLPEMETADSKSDTRDDCLEFPTDIRSDACPMNLPANIEADAIVDETASRIDKETDMMKSQRRTMEWQKDFGVDKNIDDGQEKEMNESQKDLSFQEEAVEEKHLPGDEILHSELIEKLLSSNTEYEERIMRFAEQLSDALLTYSQTGDTRTLLQAQKHLLSTEDENGDTPLHLAVIHKQPEALKAILSVVATIKGQTLVNQKNKLDQTPLHLSVITKSAEMVEMLLASGADPNILDQKGYNSLHLAIDGRFHAAIGALIDGREEARGTRTIPVDKDALNLSGYSALHMAVENRDITAARNLIQNGANKNIPDGKSGRVPLHFAVLAEDYTMLSYLVADAKVDIHAEDFSSNTPLHLAAAYDLSAVAALLIAAGANPDSRNWDMVNDDSDDSCMNEECEWEDGDYEDEEGDAGERLGSSALDYAKSDQMRRVLLGESYFPIVTSSSEGKSGSMADLLRMSSYTDSSKPMKSSSSGSRIDSGVYSEGKFKSESLQGRSIRQGDRDISSLSDKVKSSLVEALDSRHSSTDDWRAFASHLGMGNMVNHLRSFDSPTKILLEQYQLMDGTLVELRQVANAVGRKDVVEILNNAMNDEVGGK